MFHLIADYCNTQYIPLDNLVVDQTFDQAKQIMFNKILLFSKEHGL